MVGNAPLSERENQLLDLAAAGMTDQAIATHLGISLPTVSTYWGRVRIKMGPHSRTELVATYIRDISSTAVLELRERNRELQGKLSEADEKAKTLGLLLHDAPEAIFIVDGTGIINQANVLACELFGYEDGELNGKRIGILIPPELHERHKQLREAFIENRGRMHMGDHHGLRGVKKDGTEILVAAVLSTIDTDNGVCVFGVFKRVAEPKHVTESED